MRPKLLDVNCQYGAPLGRHSYLPDDPAATRWHLYRLPFIDGCYDRGGAYWGAPANIWRAVTPTGDGEIFVRARTREEAKAAVLDSMGGAEEIRFFR